MGLLLFVFTLKSSVAGTALLFLIVVVAGNRLCQSLVVKTSDPKLEILPVLWIIKIWLCMAILYAGWIPQLDMMTSSSWGYDPQRYYVYAVELINNNWRPVQSTNYQGIVYFYGLVFYLFGVNPVAPALVNTFITLVVTLYLIKVLYEIRIERSQTDWVIVFTLLVPEVVWYDALTSRESLAAALVLICLLSYIRFYACYARVSVWQTASLVGSCFIALLAVRASMAISVVLSVVAITLLIDSRFKFSVSQKLIVSTLAVCLLALGPWMAKVSGGYEIDYLSFLRRVFYFRDNIASVMDWSENSIGLMLAPNGFLEAVIYLIPRTVLYLIAPLPNLSVSLDGLLDGGWAAWQRFLTIASSCLMASTLPFVLAGLIGSIRRRKEMQAHLAIHIGMWVTMLTIAGGNIIIHERYRVMVSLLYFACAWLGYTTARREDTMKIAVFWTGFLVVGFWAYYVYKT